MRFAIWLSLLTACGGPAVSRAPGAPATRSSSGKLGDEGKDPLEALRGVAGPSSWLRPGAIQLELGTPVIGATVGAPIEVALFDHAPGVVRAAVRMENARFAVWSDRRLLLPVLASDQKIEPLGPPLVGSAIGLTLRRGAVVEQIGHRDKEKRSEIRYRGAIEVEGWVPDSALTDRAPHQHAERLWRGGPQFLTLPGVVIRTEPRWAGSNNQLARVASARGFLLDKLAEVDHAWNEVGYEDGEVSVRGYASLESPPDQTHPWPQPDPPLAKATPNTQVGDGVCLYARAEGEAIGYLIGAQQVELAAGTSAAWWTVTLDTPWGPIAFAVRGASAAELETCKS